MALKSPCTTLCQQGREGGRQDGIAARVKTSSAGSPVALGKLFNPPCLSLIIYKMEKIAIHSWSHCDLSGANKAVDILGVLRCKNSSCH